jgi:hypothetical protein
MTLLLPLEIKVLAALFDAFRKEIDPMGAKGRWGGNSTGTSAYAHAAFTRGFMALGIEF